MKHVTSLIILVSAILAGCSGSEKGGNASDVAAKGEPAEENSGYELPLPEVPAALSDPQARGEYIVTHFWDGLDFTDRKLSLDTAFMEQSFANFASLFGVVGGDAVAEGMRILVEHASADGEASAFIASIAEKYLYDPNSPMLDEASYMRFAEAFTGNANIDASLKARPEWLLGVARKNRPGSRAADFGFTTRNGVRNTLHRWVAASMTQTLLVFYDPDCEGCKEIIGDLSTSERLASMITSGELRVLAVYPDDDRELWERTCGTLPDTWEVAIDNGTINRDELYVFPAMPVLYLLDSDATVVAKDLDSRAVR